MLGSAARGAGIREARLPHRQRIKTGPPRIGPAPGGAAVARRTRLPLLACGDEVRLRRDAAPRSRDRSPARCTPRGLWALVGGTPLLEIRCRFDGQPSRIYAKYEQQNMTGRIKDRMALHILARGLRDRRARPGDVIVEATSGNTGISFAAIGRALGHPVRIYMPDWMSRERVLLIQSFGAEIVPVSRGSRAASSAASRMADELRRASTTTCSCRTSSTTRPTSRRTTQTTGPEILAAARRASAARRRRSSPASAPAARSWASAGSCASVSPGRRRCIRSSPPTRPRCAPATRSGTIASRASATSSCRAIVDLDELDEIVDVWDGDAILMAQRLASELGIAVGHQLGREPPRRARRCADAQGATPSSSRSSATATRSTSRPTCAARSPCASYLTPRIELLSFRSLPPA